MFESAIKSCDTGSKCHVIRDLNIIVKLLNIEKRVIVNDEKKKG